MKKLLVIGDTDGLIGFINPNDPHNQQAQAIIAFISQQNAQLSFPATTIAEATTTLQRKYSNPQLAQLIIDQYRANNLNLLPVDENIIRLATTLFYPHGSKQNTFFDAIVAAVAKQQQADAIFSFDGWYTKQGLTLAVDLLKETGQAA